MIRRCLLGVTLLAGCGGGAEPAFVIPNFAGAGGVALSPAQLSAASDALTEARGALTTPLRPAGVAQATMNGVMGFPTGGGSYVAGNLSLSANFNLNTVTGSTSGFSRFDSLAAGTPVLEPLTGSLAVSGGVLSGAGLTASLSGTLTGTTTNGTYNGALTGNVYVYQGKTVTHGVTQGTWRNGGGPLTTTKGSFIASE